MPTILIVGINVTQTRDALRRAERLGLTVHIADSADNLAAHADLLSAATVRSEVDFTVVEDVVALVGEVNSHGDLVGVIAFEEYALHAVAEANARFGLPGVGPQAVRDTLSKHRTRQLLAAAGLPSIAFTLGHAISDVYDFGARHGYPLIIKPDNLKASIGVRKIRTAAEVDAQYAQLTRYIDPDDGFMIEEFICGTEFSIEGIVYRGVPRVFSSTEKILVPGTSVEGGHLTPFRHPILSADFVDGYIGAICRALEIDFGPFHVESFIVGDRVVVGEVHTRFGGDQITTITELSRGCDLHTGLFSELAGLPYDVRTPEAEQAIGVFFFCPPPGKLVEVLMDPAFGPPQVLRHAVTKKRGDLLRTVEDSYDRAGWFIIRGSDRDELLARAEQLRHLIRFNVEASPIESRP